ncbi:MAG TPA: hypothetical protein PKD18_12610 [Saprospiraceae bacterium]|nr:hypothetical protein [Saprospiraceae bacterium]
MEIDLHHLPIPTHILLTYLGDYKRPLDKISYMIKRGELISLTKGYYLPKGALKSNKYYMYDVANTVYGPSYVSTYSALSYYGLISESTRTVSSSCFKRSRIIQNKIGTFEYKIIPENIFSIGIKNVVNDQSSFLIANPEKALCDLIWTSKNLKISNYSDMIYFLEEDLRFDMDFFKSADIQTFKYCIEFGKKKRELSYFLKCINVMKNVE